MSPTSYQAALIVKFRDAANKTSDATNVRKILSTDGPIAGLFFLLKMTSDSVSYVGSASDE